MPFCPMLLGRLRCSKSQSEHWLRLWQNRAILKIDFISKEILLTFFLKLLTLSINNLLYLGIIVRYPPFKLNKSYVIILFGPIIIWVSIYFLANHILLYIYGIRSDVLETNLNAKNVMNVNSILTNLQFMTNLILSVV